jgi:hypothetical protein
MKTTGWWLPIGLLLISHNASSCESLFESARCHSATGDFLAWNATFVSSQAQWSGQSNLPAASLQSEEQESQNSTMTCPAILVSGTFDEFRRGAHSCHARGASVASQMIVLSANRLTTCDGGAQLHPQCTRALVEQWWDAARRVTLDF